MEIEKERGESSKTVLQNMQSEIKIEKVARERNLPAKDLIIMANLSSNKIKRF